ncbi:Zinc finger, PMZ-type, partial [Sesbania bispinosa]
VGRYVHYRNNLTRFLKQFTCYLGYTRQRELEADFESIIGEPVLQTSFEDIERSAAQVYTRKVFLLFRTVLDRACGVKVVGCEETPNCLIYVMCKRSYPDRKWYVSMIPSITEFKCSCLRMESVGIPCEHIIALLRHLEIKVLPESLVMQRWTKNAKQCIEDSVENSSAVGRSKVISLLSDCYEVCRLSGKCVQKLDLSKQTIWELFQRLRDLNMQNNTDGGNDNDDGEEVHVRDPVRARTKGCGPRTTLAGGKGNRRTTCCSICQEPGHNKKTCPN